MIRRTALGTVAALAAATGAQALDIQPVLTAEVLVEGIAQRNYTDGNSEALTRVDPTVYNGLLSGITLSGSGYVLGSLQVDPQTWQLMVPDSFRQTYYEDNVNQMWLRASLGTVVEITNKAEIRLSLVFDAEGGDQTHRGAPGRNRGEVYLNEANILFKDLFVDDLKARFGRQDFYLNLRRNHPGFLYDSRSDNPAVYGWDGVRAYYDIETFTFFPYGFILNAAREERGNQVVGTGTAGGTASSKDNWLVGLQVDWQPLLSGDNRVFVTAGLSLEKNATVRAANVNAGRLNPLIGESLINYHFGIELELGAGLTFYGEGVLQDGKLDSERDFEGFGYTAGIEYEIGGIYNAVAGLQFDFQSGDRNAVDGLYNRLFNGPLLGNIFTPTDKVLIASIIGRDPSDRAFRNFSASWEGVSDTYIVEHERYGELSEMMTGNLYAGKGKLEYRFDQQGTLRLKALYAYYALDVPTYDLAHLSSGANYFGQEIDFTLNWKYSHFTSLSLMSGLFLPGLGYQQVAALENPSARYLSEQARDLKTFDVLVNGSPTGLTTLVDFLHPALTQDDPIIFFGVNAQVVF